MCASRRRSSIGMTRPAPRTPLSVTMRTRDAPTCCSGVATVSATPRPKVMRVGMRNVSTRPGITRGMLGAWPAARIDRGAGGGRRPATDALLAARAVRAPRLAGRALAPARALDVRVDACEQQREHRGREGAPEREEEDTCTSHETTAHVLAADAGLDDGQRVQRGWDEQDRCPRGPADVLVRDVEGLLDVDRGTKLREPHHLRRLGCGDDDRAVLERERDHDRALLAPSEVAPCLLDHRGR